MGESVRIVVVDDHEMVRKGLLSYLMTEPDFEIAGEGSSGREAVQLVKEKQPDVVLMDLLMENGTGVEATKEIMAFAPECKIIIITSFYDEDQVIPAIEAGAFSYLLKTAKAENITDAIKKAVDGESVIEARAASTMMNRFRSPRQKRLHEELTKRELEVLQCLGEGMTNQEICDELFIGIKTVKTHVSHILSKLEVQDRTQAAVYANRHNITRST